MSRTSAAAALLLVAAAGCARQAAPVVPTGDIVPAVVANYPELVELSLFLIGDAGSPSDDEPVFAALKSQVFATKGKSIIVFLGDNIYLRGLPDTNGIGRKEAERRIDEQIEVATATRTETYFIPGNHDWAYMGPTGWDAIRRQAAYIAHKGAPFALMVPRGGCPGPEYVDPSPHLRLVMLDTQWWVHDYARPHDSTSACATYTPSMVVNALNRQLLSAGDRHVVVVGHHPLASGGTHGGNLGWEGHLFPLRAINRKLWIPLPLVGSYYTLNRQQGSSDQDIAGPRNERMRRAFELVFALRKPLVYAAGH
nr:metallophosphoesterase [Gemmatimonadales bacterium]